MIHLERGVLGRAGEIIRTSLDADRLYIVADSGLPKRWLDELSSQLPEAQVLTAEDGEANKSLDSYAKAIAWLAENRATRRSVVVALGGGALCDLVSFVAATYMRGIRYANIPTTLLSQVDSSIGGKAGLNLGGTKNLIGAFYPPSLVLIDPAALETLPENQFRSGLAEVVKVGMVGDSDLFELIEKFTQETALPRIANDGSSHTSARMTSLGNLYTSLGGIVEEIILRSLELKKKVIEADEFENASNNQLSRKLLNFGHTYGHAYESIMEGMLTHGECVAMGMVETTKGEEARARLTRVLLALGLPTRFDIFMSAGLDAELPARIVNIIRNDKKADGDLIDLVLVDEIGSGYIESTPIDALLKR